ncbi:hypothetical protein K6119_09595 [Paracrocinitomix mangrovi]|uniref:toxin-antitoxin system YwqK family antitoxin n=1 Tax=Paracrocinitomix mangrovi TaxID=2862509 RepID=UPI001C8E7838|nr:hypothetical protein [Paracrocinitomix mangrovi]UKN03744.1 hypothetical protein K6119_09595 [Paracrocinitomix mangrovi]
MKLTTIISLLFISQLCQAQSDSLIIDWDDFCQNTYSESPDSLHQSFYVNESMDTVYFINSFCSVAHQITSPVGITIYFTKEGKMDGNYFLKVVGVHHTFLMQGEFIEGRFMKGIFTNLYPSGSIESIGRYEEGLATGIWTHYKENGCLDYKCEMVDIGICVHL